MDDDTDNEPEHGSHKRRNDGTDQPRVRAKRNRYISIACNECKRRKIKCNGQSPCQRCGNLNLVCVYAPNCCSNFKESEEYHQVSSDISSLQQQVEALNTQMQHLRNQLDSGVNNTSEYPAHGSRHSQSASSPTTANGVQSSTPRLPRFHGPTSAQFNLGVAKSSLRNIGIDMADSHTPQADQSPAATPPPIHSMPPSSTIHEEKDPIWLINRDEAIRLAQSWKENVYIMYPIIDIDRLFQYIDRLYKFLEAARRTGLAVIELPGAGAISDDETNKLKLVLASSLTMEASGPSELGEKLFRSVAGSVQSLLLRPPELKYIEQLLLAAVYAFHRDDEILAWRLLGFAGRMGLELGIHKQSTYEKVFSSTAERYRATILLWTIYILDRRWSFGTGLPFFIQECDIDPMLLRPDSPYLSNMIELTAISSKMWPRIANFDGQVPASNVKEMELIDLEVIHWFRNLPSHLKYDPEPSRETQTSRESTNGRIKVLLYLRANQTRILIGRPLFLSTSAIMDNLQYASAVMSVAKDTIRVLRRLNQTTPFYKAQEVLFNYFLISALAALFLAVAHAPAQFNATCRVEFYMALDLVRGMTTNSFIGRRLWQTIKILREVGPMIGLTTGASSAIDSSLDAHSSAAAAMTSLAGHQAISTPPMMVGHNLAAATVPGSSAPLGETWDGMTADLTSLFESARAVDAASADGQGRLLAHQDGLSRVFRDLF